MMIGFTRRVGRSRARFVVGREGLCFSNSLASRREEAMIAGCMIGGDEAQKMNRKIVKQWRPRARLRRALFMRALKRTRAEKMVLAGMGLLQSIPVRIRRRN